MSKRKPAQAQRKNQEINKKAIIWTGSILAAIIVLMIVLIIYNQ